MQGASGIGKTTFAMFTFTVTDKKNPKWTKYTIIVNWFCTFIELTWLHFIRGKLLLTFIMVCYFSCGTNMQHHDLCTHSKYECRTYQTVSPEILEVTCLIDYLMRKHVFNLWPLMAFDLFQVKGKRKVEVKGHFVVNSLTECNKFRPLNPWPWPNVVHSKVMKG